MSSGAQDMPLWQVGDHVKCKYWSGTIFRPGNVYLIREIFRECSYAKIETETVYKGGKRHTADIPYYMVGTHFELINTKSSMEGAEEYEQIMKDQEALNGT